MNQPVPPVILGTKALPKSTHGGNHFSSCIFSRGWLCWLSMREDVLSLVKAQCTQCRGMPGQESKSGWVGEQGQGGGIREGVFFREESRNGDNF